MNQHDLEKMQFLQEYSALTEMALESLTLDLSRPGATAPMALRNLQKWRNTLRIAQEERLNQLHNLAH